MDKTIFLADSGSCKHKNFSRHFWTFENIAVIILKFEHGFTIEKYIQKMQTK